MSNSKRSKRKMDDATVTDKNDVTDDTLIIDINDPLRAEFHMTLSVQGGIVNVLSSRIPGNIDDDVVFTEGHQLKKNRGLTVTVNGEPRQRLWMMSDDAVKACEEVDLAKLRTVVADHLEWNSAIMMKQCIVKTIPVIQNLHPMQRRLFYDALRPLFRALQQHVPVKSPYQADRIRNRSYFWENPKYIHNVIEMAANAYDFGLMHFLKPFVARPTLFGDTSALTDAFIKQIRKQPRSNSGVFGDISSIWLRRQGWDIRMIQEVFALSKYRGCGSDIRYRILGFIFGAKNAPTMFIHHRYYHTRE